MMVRFRSGLFGLAAGALLMMASPTAVLAQDYSEAPALSALVAAGDLPPVDERLPANPRVLEPVDSVGVYGGTWRTGARESAETWTLRTVGYDHMVHWLPDWSGVVPNIAESVEANDDATVYTFTLRDGMRWSDGEPFDVDDILFAYEVFQHEDLADFPAYLRTGDGPGVIERVDDHTFTITFPVPNAGLLTGMAQVTTAIGGDALTLYPEHYMRQFHADHNADNLDELIADAGVSTWQELFTLRTDLWLNGGKPTLNAWIVTTPFGEGTRVIAERNPYYWKVDSAGNQLPYIDRVVFEVVQDPEVLLLKAIAGEIDMTASHINTVENRAVLFDNMERGNYDFFEVTPSDANLATYSFNQAHRDPVLREILQNRDFRAALSHAIDRQEIIDLVFIGQGTPAQTAVLPGFPELYNEQLATQYLEYDVDRANEMLDAAGFADRDADGHRLGPDGNPIRLSVLTRSDKQFMVDTTEMVVGYWQDVGIDARMDVVERSLVRQRKNANEHDVIIEDFPGGNFDAYLRPTPWVPIHHNAAYGIPWFYWWQGNEGAEEPPAHVVRQLELWDRMNATVDQDQRAELMREMLQIAADSFYTIGVVVPLSNYGIVSNRMHNVPDRIEGSYWFAPPGPTNPPTYYFVDGTNDG